MPSFAEKLAEEAMQLPCDERAHLVEKLLQSLNVPTRVDIDRLWAEEAERRVAEIDRGDVTPIDGEQVFREIRDRLRK